MAPTQKAELILPADKAFLPLARAFVRELYSLAGISSQEGQNLELAVEEACAETLDQGPYFGETGTFTLKGELGRSALILAVFDQGLPFDPCSAPSYCPPRDGDVNRASTSGLGLFLIRHAADHVEWINHGREGKEMRLTKYLPQADITEHLAKEELTPFRQDEPPAPEQCYTIRQLSAKEAIMVSQCIYRAYGYSYPDDYMYYPERIVHMNETGKMISEVALDEAGKIVGHCALVRHDQGLVAELDHAVVAPANRKGGLLQRMTSLLEKESCSKSLKGIYVQSVTSHTFSQRVIENLGYRECALFLGLLPRSIRFKKIRSAPLSQRESCAVYYKSVGPLVGSKVYAPDRHRETLRQIYQHLGLPAEFLEWGEPEGQGTLRVTYHSSLGFGEIKILQLGKESKPELKRGLLDLLEIAGAETIYLDLPLAQAGTPDLCTAAEAEGLFFSGLGPGFAPDGDVLTLQYLKEELDTSQVQMASPFGQKLLDYIAQERVR
jgi:anti-sigma regulatory factor (Ser/Thr protein kinase)